MLLPERDVPGAANDEALPPEDEPEDAVVRLLVVVPEPTPVVPPPSNVELVDVLPALLPIAEYEDPELQ
jgi:hypothetical protein